MKIEVYRGKGKSRHRWYFRVRASNGEIVTGGEGYTRSHCARRGFERLAVGILRLYGVPCFQNRRWVKMSKDLYVLD